MKKPSLLLTAGLLATAVLGQDRMPITTNSEVAEQNFIAARETLSLVWITGGIEQLEVALEQDTTLAIAYVYQGASYAFLGKDRSKSFAAANKHGATATEGERMMIEGWIHLFSGKSDSAEIAFARVVDLHPKDEYARHMLGDVYRTLDRHADALAMLKPLVNRTDPYIAALNHIAYTYKDMGNADSALIYMQRFIDADPTNANAYHSMAEMHLEFGDVPNALLYFQKALLADRFFAAAARDMGDVLAENGEPYLASKALGAALECGTKLYGDRFQKGVQDRLDKLDLR